MNPDYAAIATAAKSKARDILRAQMAVRIQERVQKASDCVVSAIRHYAKLVVDAAEAATAKFEADAKKATRRDAFTQALGQVPGVGADDLKLASDAIAKERAERDAEAVADEEAETKRQTSVLESAAKRITEAQNDFTHANENLTKLNAGELKVNADELTELAATLIEEERADN